MSNNTIPAELQEEISNKADEYARTYSGTKMIKRPYIAGATEYAIWKVKFDQAEKLLQRLMVHRASYFPSETLYNEIKSFLDGTK